MKSLAALTAAAALCGCATAAAPPPPLAIEADLDAFIENAVADLGVVPGLSVAVYTPDGVYARGFGVTDVDTGEPVTADTAFYVASSTKSFTAMAMKILESRGEIDLGQTLAAYAPDAAFPDAVRPGDVTLTNLLTHTSGMDNGPIVYRSAFTGQHTPEILWDLLSASVVNEDAPLGAFDYTNVGYNILTVLTDRARGERWQDLIAREVFEPAGMTHATAYMSKAEREGWSLAKPHFTVLEGGPVRISLMKTDATMQSAGGAVMSANDALRWLDLLIHDGELDGEQVIPADVVRATRERLAVVDGSFGDYGREHYGLGWYIGPYRDELMVHHFGGFAGFRAHVSYLPEKQIGVAAFVNDSSAAFELVDVVANYAYDRLAGYPDAEERGRDGVQRLVERRDQGLERVAADIAARGAREWTLTRPRAAYAGTYDSELLGTLVISLDGDDIYAELGNLSSIAQPFTEPDTIRTELVPFSGNVIGFEVADDGTVAAAIVQGIRFERR